MATLHIYAGNLERFEAMIYETDAAKARYHGADKLIEHLLNENVLELARAGTKDFDPQAAEAALNALVRGPRPEGPLNRLHALVLHGIIETLCPHIGDDAFGATTIHELSDFGHKWRPVFGEAILESLSTRRLPFTNFSDEVASPHFSYWMHDEIKHFLARMPAALQEAGDDAATLQLLHRLKDVWTDVMGQGPDALLVAIV